MRKAKTEDVEVVKNKVWAIIPARGGSKSIPMKNLVSLAGRPLLEYVTRAAEGSSCIDRIICSTENQMIADFALEKNIEVHHRPTELAQDDTPLLDVLVQMLQDLGRKEGTIADILLILQPTSPFVLPEHIDTCIKMLRERPDMDSVQTISTFPHNFHAYNQRIIENGILKFRFPNERRACYNKQTKPTHYIFGNLIATRGLTVLEKKDIFGDRSLPFVIPFRYATDIDGPEDLEVAEWLLETGKVKLPFRK